MFLESRIALLTTLFLGEFVLLWVWARWPTRRTRRLALCGLAMGILLLVIQTLVVTDREQIMATCRELALAVEDGVVTFRRAGDGWQVVEIRPIPTPSFPFSTLEEVLRSR